jgi:hypothetical protein
MQTPTHPPFLCATFAADRGNQRMAKARLYSHQFQAALDEETTGLFAVRGVLKRLIR